MVVSQLQAVAGTAATPVVAFLRMISPLSWAPVAVALFGTLSACAGNRNSDFQCPPQVGGGTSCVTLAQADAQQGAGEGADRLDQSQVGQATHGVAGRPDAGQDDPFGLGDHDGLASEFDGERLNIEVDATKKIVAVRCG